MTISGSSEEKNNQGWTNEQNELYSRWSQFKIWNQADMQVLSRFGNKRVY